ncbi:hypothetical protein OKA05_27180 [Luteolibacter arcticus]|uniref:Uncharacterized protein n=1 Tax=Luteolibacter arcticus TaxID=1581411 RepID=A0ABT3GRY3_9BACT|nr:hypothetical protein [Luteolibacter arcticus]MCW1926267.1 hypothetical protein [Luteolibacter arcticus]
MSDPLPAPDDLLSAEEQPPARAGNPTRLDSVEQLSRIVVNFGKLFLLIAIGALSLWLKMMLDKREERRQQDLARTELSKPWMDEALKVLRERATPGQAPGVANPLLDWAVEVFAYSSPVNVDDDLKRELKSGAFQFDHMGTAYKSHQWRLTLGSKEGEGITKLLPGVQTIALHSPAELKEKDLDTLYLDFRSADREVDSLFEFIDIFESKQLSARGGETVRGDILIRYKLRNPAAAVADFKLIANATFEVPTEPIFARADPSDPTKKQYVTSQGKTLGSGYGYDSYGYYDYEYVDPNETAQQKAARLKKEEDERKKAFDNRWAPEAVE